MRDAREDGCYELRVIRSLRFVAFQIFIPAQNGGCKYHEQKVKAKDES
jgi:hypothetical protein